MNWLDPAGVAKGIVQLRFDGLDDQPAEAPTAELVSISALPNTIPDFDAGRIGTDARDARYEPNVGGTSRCDTGADPLSHATMQAWSSISPTPTACSRRPRRPQTPRS